jgi:phosphate transport system substrate-binding protein
VNSPKRRILAGALALTLVAAACGNDDDTADTAGGSDDTAEAPAGDGGVSGSILVSGSSTVEPISATVGNAFADLNGNVAITVNGPGTGDGFAQFCAGETDVSNASRPIKAE